MAANDVFIHNRIGVLYHTQGKWEEVLHQYQHAVQQAPSRGMCRTLLASVVRQLGRSSGYDEQIQRARGLIDQKNEYDRAF